MKLVLFDVDGTLIDSQAIIHEAMRQTFSVFGYGEPELASTKSIIGLTLDRAIASILARDVDDEILAMTAEYKEAYLSLAGKETMHSMPFNGMPELIDRLSRRDDIVLGLVTGKSRRGVQKLFQNPIFEDKFSVSRCADDCPSKPHPAMVRECCVEMGVSPINTIVVGDTGFDMEMACAAGANSIGVSWGYHSIERMKAAGARQIVDSVPVLEDRLRTFIEPMETSVASSQGAKSFVGMWLPQHA